MTSSHQPPDVLGCTRATMADNMGGDVVTRSETHKVGTSSDQRMQLAFVESEVLVSADQHDAVNKFPGVVHTARHNNRVVRARSRWPNPKEREAPKV